MRNIDKIIDEIVPPIDQLELSAIANLIAIRKTEQERMDLVLRCSRKFNLQISVLEEKVKEALKYEPSARKGNYIPVRPSENIRKMGERYECL